MNDVKYIDCYWVLSKFIVRLGSEKDIFIKICITGSTPLGLGPILPHL